MATFIDQFNNARRVSTPIIAVRTPDIEATIKTIALNKDNADSPMVLWDAARGITAVNQKGQDMVRALCTPMCANCGVFMTYKGPQYACKVCKETAAALPPTALANPQELLMRGMITPKESILFAANLHRFLHEPVIVQAVWNLRDFNKTDTRTLVILCPGITLPAEISSDVLVLDEPLPDAKQLEGIVGETYTAVGLTKPNEETTSRAVDALCGLAAFPAEQVCAMSIKKDGLDLEQLWERKRQQIEQTPGLSVWRGKERFANIGGCENIKEFLTRIMNGGNRPRAIVFQDEIEKAFAGAAGDTSGTTQELLGNQLSFMQDHKSTGLLLLGVPGAAKSAIAKAFGNEAGVPVIQFDLGAMKGSLVGESNQNMRNGLKVVEAVSQGRALWIATCNDIRNLPPELRRRYIFGTFFFDLPTPAERALIWKIYFDKLELKKQELPLDTGWTGAEIENCCEIASRLKISPKEASDYIIPIAKSASERINSLRAEANERYISAAKPGPYKAPEGVQEEGMPEGGIAVLVFGGKGRKINTGDKGGDLPPAKGSGRPN